MKIAVVALLGFALVAAQRTGAAAPRPYTMVLGIAQDGGIPQAGCRKSCCTSGRHERVARLGGVDPASHRWWLIDATPDFPSQLAAMAAEAPACSLAGIRSEEHTSELQSRLH